MKEIKERKQTNTYNDVVSITCDICHKKYKGDSWEAQSSYDVLETEIKYKDGYSYPEGGSGMEVQIDICPDCFRNKLVPWVESFGSKVETKKWDF